LLAINNPKKVIRLDGSKLKNVALIYQGKIKIATLLESNNLYKIFLFY